MPREIESLASSSNGDSTSFESFLEGWWIRHEHYQHELLSAQQPSHQSRDNNELRSLINRVLAHYGQFYEEKSKITSQNIFSLFSPKWITPFERTFLWISGFKPGLVCRLVTYSVENLSAEQHEGIRNLMREIRVEERALNDEIARIHESLAIPTVVERAREAGRTFLGGYAVEGAVPAEVKAEMEAVVVSADTLRTNAVLRAVEMLSPPQNVKFLAAATELQTKIRDFGTQKEAEKQGSGEDGEVA